MTKMRPPTEEKDSEEIRLALAGAKNCGKSALAVRFLTKRFIGEYDSHEDIILQRTVLVADRSTNLQIKDTTGMEWLKNAANLINWTSAIIVVYSITDRGSFLVANHILELIHKLKPLNSGCTLLLGNKSDLKHLREVEKRAARRLAMDYGVHFKECSAAENYDKIHESFTRLILEALLVQNAKRFSGELTDDEKSKNSENRMRRRSSSHPQACIVPTLATDYEEKRDSLKSNYSVQIPSPTEIPREPLCEHITQEPVPRETPRHHRKQSLRRKISGIGSRIVGSQNGSR